MCVCGGGPRKFGEVEREGGVGPVGGMVWNA